MSLTRLLSLYLIGAVLMASLSSRVSYADDDEHEHHRHTPHIADNPTYTDQCGVCHIPYRPDLLPSGSWNKILSHLQDHNGVEVVLEAQAREIVAPYLEANSADRSGTKMSRKIMKSLNGQTPTRVTDVPYIRRKHHEIPPDVFDRESIESFSNCIACHVTAGKGIYDDDSVRIPD